MADLADTGLSKNSVELDRASKLALLIESAIQQPGLAELLEVYNQGWFRLGSSFSQLKPGAVKTVRFSTDSGTPLL